MQGYFREDAPSVRTDSSPREEKTRSFKRWLWFELDFVTLAPMRQYKDYIFFERAEPPEFMKEAQFDFRAIGRQGLHVRREDEEARRGVLWRR